MADLKLDLKILLLNAENLFLLSDQNLTPEHLKLNEHEWQKLSTSVYDNKSLHKCQALAKIFLTEDPDIIMLCEVGGLESLSNFNRLFLNDQWSPVLMEGNSNRHIDVGFLVKKGLGCYFDLVSNKNRSINYNYPHESQPKVSQKFSRDVAELHLFQKNKEQPFIIFLLTHLKSHLDPDGIDPRGSERREAELKTLVEIYNELEQKNNNQIPIVVSGDFNGHAGAKNTDHEFVTLYQKTKLLDVCESAQLLPEDSSTYYQVNARSQRVEGKHLDYCFLSPKALPLLDKSSVQIYRYKKDSGFPWDPPVNLEQKMALPSDHYPVVFTLKQIPLR